MTLLPPSPALTPHSRRSLELTPKIDSVLLGSTSPHPPPWGKKTQASREPAALSGHDCLSGITRCWEEDNVSLPFTNSLGICALPFEMALLKHVTW